MVAAPPNLGRWSNVGDDVWRRPTTGNAAAELRGAITRIEGTGGCKAHPEHDGVDDEVGGGRTATESCSHAVAGVGGGASIRRIPAFLPRTTRWRSRGGAGDGQRPCRRRQRRRGRPRRRRKILAAWRRLLCLLRSFVFDEKMAKSQPWLK